MKIKKISAEKILGSLGNETIGARILLENGVSEKAHVPFGISRGKYEVKNVIPDEAVAQVNKIKDSLIYQFRQGHLKIEADSEKKEKEKI